MRPSILGEFLAPVGLVGLSIVGLRFTGLRAFRSLRFLIIVFFIFAYWAFRGQQWLGWGDASRAIATAKSCIIELTAFWALFGFLGSAERARTAVHQIAVVLTVLGLSSAVSSALSFAGLESVISFAHFIRNPDWEESMVYVAQFPFSVFYGVVQGLSGNTLYRYTGGFTEAGIFPAFACWCLSYTWLTRCLSKRMFLGLLVGTLATFSTAAVLCIAVSLPSLGLLWTFSLKRMELVGKILLVLTFMLFFVLGVVLVYYMPDVGLRDKSQTQTKSIDDRALTIQNALTDLPSNIAGHPPNSDNDQQMICLLAATYSLGLVGTVLWFAKTAAIFLWAKRTPRFRGLAVSAAVIAALLVAQPIYDYNPIVIMSLMAAPLAFANASRTQHRHSSSSLHRTPSDSKVHSSTMRMPSKLPSEPSPLP